MSRKYVLPNNLKDRLDINQPNLTDSDITTKMNTQDIESQIIQSPSFVSKKPTTGGYDVFSESCCAKFCVAITTTILLSPFAICDLYYASSDDACVNQDNHGLAITMHSYLLASGTMTFIIIGGFNASVLLTNFESFQPSDEIRAAWIIIEWILKIFGTSWLILGCVLLWAYTDLSQCSQTTHDYLFARFILGIMFHIASIRDGNGNKSG